jgi:cyclic beta-1,2-glucan synthetase
VRFQHRQADLSADLEVVVDPEEDVEVRRLVLANRSDELRHVTVASHAEVCLAPEREDRRHPAFSKLFVESRYLAREHALLFRRRPRAPQERPPVLLHALLSSPRARTRIGHDASRETFLGRLRRRARPCALDASPVVLAGTTGATLDPVLALSASFDLAPRAYVELAWVTVVGESEAEVRRIAARRRSFAAADRTVDAARIYGDALLRRRGIDPDSVPAIQRLLSLLRHPHHALRAPPAVLASSCQTVEVLWRHGISGDRPIVLVRVRDEDDVGFLAQVLRAHGLLRVLGVASDLVAFDETGTGYASNAQDRLRRALEASALHDVRGAAGGVFPVQANRLPPAEHDFLLAVARVVLDPHAGDLETQLGAPYRVPPRLPGLVTTESVPRPTASLEDVGPRLFDNGMGGFSPDGTAYVIRLDEEEVTPAPWCNVLANPHFGALVSESGGGCTWSENAALHRLTPWRNDPLQDAPTEALYLRDEETGAVWSPTPRPAPGPGPYEVRHEAGRTRFRHASQALEQRLDVFVAADDPVKVFHLSLRNRMAGHRRLTVTFFAEWILGEDPVAHGPYVVPTYHRDEEVLVAHGLLGADQPARVAFAATTRPLHGLTADRTEFLGRCGRRDHPAALDRVGLAGTVEPGRDPCAALQVHVDLAPGGEAQVAFLLGQAESEEAAISCVRRAREPEFVARALQRVRSTWEGLLGSLQVRTPEPALDLFVNRWLRLATVAGRLFGRIGPYQASGAFGFRDQLQDVLALVGGWPDVVRAHLLRAAAHQFPEGDVLHWWHPLTGVGVRTRCSDDLLWLPFAVAQYVEATGDRAVLAETVRFLAGAPLEDGEDERYARYDPGSEAASLHEHCLRALRRAQAYGSRGLPRIGTGDWNDGMNRVGREGRGESVWLGWFLGTCLRRYATVCDLLGETEHAAEKRALADRLAERVDAVAWDGAWYVRAFDDDGAPLGSSRCEEGRIDVLPQAWAALAGGGRADRAARALQSAWEHLVREDDGLVLLLAPPFDRTAKDPGYIKAYPPGVRENGGQYSHAAAWLAWAFAESGDPDRALAVFRLVLPTRHTATRAAAGRYRVEPYVVAADVYGPPQHAGRGGWTWYTGASAWLQRFAVEGLLGIRQEGDGFVFDPRLPSAWDGYEAVLRRGSTVWKVRVRRGTPAAGAVEVRLDGRALPEARVPRREDGAEHAVEVTVR